MVKTVASWFDDEELVTAPETLAHIKALVESPGWLIISNILDQQAQMRLNNMVTAPLNSLDGALAQEYIKGEAAQLLTLRGLPTVLIEELQAAVKEMQKDVRTDSSSDASSSS